MKVLIADPDGALRDVVRTALGEFGYRALSAATLDEARRMIAAERPEIVLVSAGLDGLRRDDLRPLVARRDAEAYRYVVAIVGSGDPASVREVMLGGADDFLAAPFLPEHLHARLQVAERFILLQRDLSDQRAELNRTGQALSAGARTDSLTQLGNRIQLHHDIAQAQGQLLRYGHQYAAAVIDLDRGTEFGEAYGPLAADEALRLLAETILHQLRTGDRAYRYAGNEIVVLFPEQSSRSARIAVERIREAVAALAMPHAGNPPWGMLTVSAGIATFTPSEDREGLAYDDLIGRAEAALARARRHGGNRVHADDGSGVTG